MMAYVSSFVYAEQIQRQRTKNGDMQNQIINPLQSLNLISVPSHFSFTVSCVISSFEMGKEHTIKIDFLDPHEKVIATIMDEKVPDTLSPEEIERYKGIQVDIDIRNFVFVEEGTYLTRIYFDEVIIGEYNIPVISRGYCNHAK